MATIIKLTQLSMVALFVFFASLAVGHAAIVYAPSATYSDVSAAVSSAGSGDTVIVPAGSVTWSNPLVIAKPITLLGNGSSNTVITGAITAGRGIVEYNNPTATSTSFRLTGFTLQTNGTGYPLRLIAAITSLAIVSNVRVDHNVLTDSPNSIAISVEGSIMYGVVDHNTITGYISNESGAGQGKYAFEGLPSTFGGPDNLYFEDNTITATATVFMSSGHGSRYVARYNTFLNSTRGMGGLDVHGNMKGPAWTNMVFEAYGNYTDNTGYDGQLAFIHGGINLAFYNAIADSTATRIQLAEFYNDDLYWYNSPPSSAISSTTNTFTFNYSILPTDAAGKMGIRIVAGTGKGQIRSIIGRADYYTGTVDSNWGTALDSTSVAALYYTTGLQSEQLQHVNDSYFWNNRRSDGDLINAYISMDYWYNGTGLPASVVNDPYVIAENRDFWQQRDTFTGAVRSECQHIAADGSLVDTCGMSGGVGAGTLSAIPSTCIVGVGYWATNQSTTDLTGLVGASHTSNISGTLYKCTAANTWTAYYTPYTYPHPLTRLRAPQGLRIIR